MNEGGKGRRTPRRSEVKVSAARVAASMRAWLEDRFAAAQKRNAAAGHARPSGHGVTLEMKAISAAAGVRETEWVVQHSAPNRAQRRRGVVSQAPTGFAAPNQPHINLARDLKRGRRLRGA